MTPLTKKPVRFPDELPGFKLLLDDEGGEKGAAGYIQQLKLGRLAGGAVADNEGDYNNKEKEDQIQYQHLSLAPRPALKETFLVSGFEFIITILLEK